MKTTCTLLFLCLLIGGCKPEPADVELKDQPEEIEIPEENDSDTTEINSESEENEELVEKREYKDLSYLPEEHEYFYASFEGEDLEIGSTKLENIKVSARYETSITVMNEGPHCDLDKWIHGYTSWQTLKRNDRYVLEDLGYTRYAFERFDFEEDFPFPITDMDTIRAEIRKNCGDFWADHTLKCDSPWDYPCNVSISAFIIRVYGTVKETGEKGYFLVRLPQWMGC